MARIVMVVLMCLLLVGCISLTPEQDAKLDRLERAVEAGLLESKRIYDLQTDVRQQWKDGELTPDEAIKLLDTLCEQGKRVAERVAALQLEYKETKESGVPWYHIIWGVVSTAAAVFLKGAVGDVIKGVEKSGHKPTKDAIAGLNNWLVNWLVKRGTPAKSINGTGK